MLKMLHLTNLPSGPPVPPEDKPRELKDPRSPRFILTLVVLIAVVILAVVYARPSGTKVTITEASISQSAAPAPTTAELCQAVFDAAERPESDPERVQVFTLALEALANGRNVVTAALAGQFLNDPSRENSYLTTVACSAVIREEAL